MKATSLYFFLACLAVMPSLAHAVTEFVIIIPSYNNERWAEKNLLSVLDQAYDHFSVIYIDDCSTDHTCQIVEKIIHTHPQGKRVKLIKNVQRRGALENLYYAIHSCADQSVICTVDGDDWLAHTSVLLQLNNVYQNSDCWLTYGNFVIWPWNVKSWCYALPHKVHSSGAYRSHQWVTSHLRTFYAKLFKQIKKEDLLHNGAFFAMTWDLAMMFPMLEMARGRSIFIPDVLYVYNRENPLNDANVNLALRSQLDTIIRAKVPYQPLEKLF